MTTPPNYFMCHTGDTWPTESQDKKTHPGSSRNRSHAWRRSLSVSPGGAAGRRQLLFPLLDVPQPVRRGLRGALRLLRRFLLQLPVLLAASLVPSTAGICRRFGPLAGLVFPARGAAPQQPAPHTPQEAKEGCGEVEGPDQGGAGVRVGVLSHQPEGCRQKGVRGSLRGGLVLWRRGDYEGGTKCQGNPWSSRIDFPCSRNGENVSEPVFP